MKEVSAGLILDSPAGILMCHRVSKDLGPGTWDIPKGHVEPEESMFETMTRELREETGIILEELQAGEIQDLGLLEYIKKKDLYLFYTYIQDPPAIETLECSTYFTNSAGGETREVGFYCYSHDLNLLYPNLRTVIEKLRIW